MATSGMVTLDNLTEKLPLWNVNDANQLYAIVDMGSNGIRFSITSLAAPRSRLLTPVYSDRAAISLFDALEPSESGGLIFPQDTISAVSVALAQFARVALLHDVQHSHIMIFATEAMRRAANSSQMLDAISEATDGLAVQILHPTVETLLGAVMGSRSGLTYVEEGALFLDLGGGSVQMTWVETSLENYEIKAAEAGVSLPFGAAKLSRVMESGDDQLHASEIEKLRSGMHSAYENLCDKFPKLAAQQKSFDKGESALIDVYMCGGGFRGYGSMLMHTDVANPYPIPSIGTYTVEGSVFKQVVEMRRVNHEYDAKIYGMSSRRRYQFPAIAAVVEAFVAAVPNIGHVTFCKGSNREGALMMKLPRQVRESNPLEILANVKDADKPIFDAILRKISQAVPEEAHISHSRTVLLGGLGLLFVQEIWSRTGHEADSNASNAIHHAIARDPDVPGLTHQARAALAIAVTARWGESLCPSDAQLLEGLRSILDRQGEDAVFWAQYVGTVANILGKIFPIRPRDASTFDKSIVFESHLKCRKEKRDRVDITISVAPAVSKGIDLDDLAKILNTVGKRRQKKPPMKINARVSKLQS